MASPTIVLRHREKGEYLKFLIAPSRWTNRVRIIREVHTSNIHDATTMSDLMDKGSLHERFVQHLTSGDYERIDVKVVSLRALEVL